MKLKPWAVLISDVHFNINTLPLATAALKQALEHADDLGVPLIIAGDLNDTKAMLRGEVANALIDLLAPVKKRNNIEVILLVGNHDLINEKGKAHSLNFLRPYVTLIDKYTYDEDLNLHFIPYRSNTEDLRKDLLGIPRGATVIMHQGFMGAAMGEYVVDKSSIDPEEVKYFNVITGHYHKMQVVGTVHYIGTPYSITFAEANDGPKGFRVLMGARDGIETYESDLTFVPTNLRKHITVEVSYQNVMDRIEGLNPCDLLWLKVHGPASELDKLNKKAIGLAHLGHSNFKFDKLYIDEQTKIEKRETLTNDQMLDRLIDNSEETKAQRTYLKKLWREII